MAQGRESSFQVRETDRLPFLSLLLHGNGVTGELQRGAEQRGRGHERGGGRRARRRREGEGGGGGRHHCRSGLSPPSLSLVTFLASMKRQGSSVQLGGSSTFDCCPHIISIDDSEADWMENIWLFFRRVRTPVRAPGPAAVTEPFTAGNREPGRR